MSEAVDKVIQEVLGRIEANLERAERAADQGLGHSAQTRQHFSILSSRIQQEIQRHRSEIAGLQALAADLENRLKLKELESRENSRVLRNQFGEFHDRELRTQAAQLSHQYERSIAELEAELARKDQLILELKKRIEGSTASPAQRSVQGKDALARLPGIWSGTERDQ